MIKDIIEKYRITDLTITKNPPVVSFEFNGTKFIYKGNPENSGWDFDLCSVCSENVMYELVDAGYIDEIGNVKEGITDV